jgi:hypothetical protein
MKVKIQSLIIFACYFLSACYGKDEKVEKIHFQKGNNITLSDSFDYRFIRLETTDDCLIGNISRIEIFDNKIFILDFSYAKLIYAFDMNGKFIAKIGSKGPGPGEYNHPCNFTIDRENKRIIVYDMNLNKFLYYDFYGKHLYNMPGSFYHNDFLLSGDRFYFFDHAGYGKLKINNYVLVTDTFLKPVFDGWKCNFKTRSIERVTHYCIYENQNKIRAYHHLQPYIYEITSDKCIRRTELSFEGFKFPVLDRDNDETSHDYVRQLEKSETTIMAYGIYELKDVLFVQLRAGMGLHFALYNRKTAKSCMLNWREYIESAGLGTLMIPKGVSSEDEIICVISTGQDLIKEKSRAPAFSSMIDSLKPDDNPVICLMKWKN